MSSLDMEIRRSSIRKFSSALKPSDALDIIEATPPDILKNIVLLQILRAEAVWLEGKALYEKALEKAREAYELAANLVLPAIEIVCLAQRGNLLRRLGKLEEAETFLKKAMECAGQAGNTNANSWIQYEFGYLSHLKGNFDSACRQFKDSVDSAKDEDDITGHLAGLGMLAVQYYLNGMYADATASLDEADIILKDTSDDFGRELDWVERWKANNSMQRALIAIAKGCHEVAEKMFEAHPYNSDIPTAEAGKPTMYYHLGTLYFAKGDYQNAIKNLTSALRIYELRGSLTTRDECASEVIALLGRTYIAAGDTKGVEGYFNLSLTLPADLANRRGQAWSHIELAKLAMQNGEKPQARNHLDAALLLTNKHYKPEREKIESLLASLEE